MTMSRKTADIAAMRNEMAHVTHLLTYLVPADAKLDSQPLLAKARTWWRARIKTNRPMCIACKRPFSDSAEVGSFLFSTAAILPTSASVSAFCCKCAREKSSDEIDRASTRALRKIAPGGRFLDPRR